VTGGASIVGGSVYRGSGYCGTACFVHHHVGWFLAIGERGVEQRQQRPPVRACPGRGTLDVSGLAQRHDRSC
jgi:hypothetical protein